MEVAKRHSTILSIYAAMSSYENIENHYDLQPISLKFKSLVPRRKLQQFKLAYLPNIVTWLLKNDIPDLSTYIDISGRMKLSFAHSITDRQYKEILTILEDLVTNLFNKMTLENMELINTMISQNIDKTSVILCRDTIETEIIQRVFQMIKHETLDLKYLQEYGLPTSLESLWMHMSQQVGLTGEVSSLIQKSGLNNDPSKEVSNAALFLNNVDSNLYFLIQQSIVNPMTHFSKMLFKSLAKNTVNEISLHKFFASKNFQKHVLFTCDYSNKLSQIVIQLGFYDFEPDVNLVSANFSSNGQQFAQELSQIEDIGTLTAILRQYKFYNSHGYYDIDSIVTHLIFHYGQETTQNLIKILLKLAHISKYSLNHDERLIILCYMINKYQIQAIEMVGLENWKDYLWKQNLNDELTCLDILIRRNFMIKEIFQRLLIAKDRMAEIQELDLLCQYFMPVGVFIFKVKPQSF